MLNKFLYLYIGIAYTGFLFPAAAAVSIWKSASLAQSAHLYAARPQYQSALDRALQDPITHLRERRKINDKLQQQSILLTLIVSDDDEKLIKNIIESRNSLHRQNPAYTIGECDAPNCLLSRSVNPDVRKNFDSISVDSIEPLVKRKNVVRYVQFATASPSLGDLVRLRGISKLAPKKIIIHFINPKLADYIAFLKLCKTAVLADQTIVQENLNQIWAYLKKDDSGMSKEFKEVIQSAPKPIFLMCINHLHQPFCQFMELAKALYPTISMEIHVHASTQDYIAFTQLHPESLSDTIFSSDFEQSDMTADSKCIQDFKELLKYQFHTNHHSVGLYLGKHFPTQKNAVPYPFVEIYSRTDSPIKSSALSMISDPSFHSTHKSLTTLAEEETSHVPSNSRVVCADQSQPVIKNCFNFGCTKSTSKRCSKCKIAKYCSAECQLAHWHAGHKATCIKS